MEEGLYESLITTNSSCALRLITGLVADVGGVDEAEQPAVLARHVRDAVVRRLSSDEPGSDPIGGRLRRDRHDWMDRGVEQGTAQRRSACANATRLAAFLSARLASGPPMSPKP